MNFLSRGLASSFVLHAALLAVFTGLSLTATVPAPLVIDFTLQQGGEQQTALKDVQERKAEQRAPQRHVAPRKIEAPVPEQPRQPEPVAEALSGNTEQAAPVAAEPVKKQANETSASSAHARADVTREEVASSRGAGAGSGDGYARANYSYIRDMVQKMLDYPAIARRKGWQGKVIISFIICADGYVRDVSVKEGSGIELLDRNAVQAVMKALPFPRPPAEARLIIPIAYVLN